MAPTRPSKPAHKTRKLSSTSLSASAKAKPPTRISKSKSKSNPSTHRPAKQQKTRPNLHNPSPSSQKSKSQLKKKPAYTDKQLNLPALNAITPANAAPNAPAGVLNKRGKKRKVFVDDELGMGVIMGIAMAEREGVVEGRVRRLRVLEGIREGRVKAAEGQKGSGAGRVGEAGNGLKKRRRRDKDMALAYKKREGEEAEVNGKVNGVKDRGGDAKKKRKKVAFA